MGEKDFRLEDYKKAIENYTKAIDANPKLAVAYTKRGYSKRFLKDYNSALIDCSKAIEFDSTNAWAYTVLGLVYESLREYNMAIKIYNKASTVNPTYSRAYFHRGYSKEMLQDKQGAVDDYNKAIELDPNDISPHNHLAMLKEELKDYDGAIKDYSKVIVLEPKNRYAYNHRGDCKFAAGDKAGACADWQQAVNLGSHGATNSINKYCKPHRKSIEDSLFENMPSETKMWLKSKTDSINELIKNYSKLIEQNPKDDKAYYMRANAKSELVKYIKEPHSAERRKKEKIIYADEINDLIEVTKLNSKYADTAYYKIYSLRVVLFMGNKDSLGKSAYYLEKAVAINPKYTMAWFLLANAYYSNDKKAINCYTKIIELKDTLLTNEAYRRRGNRKKKVKDYQGAIEDFTQAIKTNKAGYNLYEIYFERGFAKYDLQDYKGAIEDYTKTIDLVPKYTMFYYYRGNAKFKSADKQGACADWSKAKPKEMINSKWVSVTDTISKYCK